jgi:SAM-dependent methyltransferase
MPHDMIPDVPSPIDLRNMADAQEWEQSAMIKRPWRTEFFSSICSAIATAPLPVSRILELGSGPGFLAKSLLDSLSGVTCTLLDFSPAMHKLAKIRLGNAAHRAEFVERSFKEPTWPLELGKFECVVTNQAIHELRHKRYAPELHAQVKTVLAPGGIYLVCDHFAGEGGMKNDQLFMSVAEQEAALLLAGFTQVHIRLLKGGLVLHRAA